MKLVLAALIAFASVAATPAVYAQRATALSRPHQDLSGRLIAHNFERHTDLKTLSMTVRLEIGPRGLVTGCRPMSSQADAETQKKACWMMIGARFDPARDAAGKGVASVYVARLNWTRPADTPAPPVAAPPDRALPMLPTPPVTADSLPPIQRLELPAGATRPAPLSIPSDWVTEDDYPADALREAEEGPVSFTLWIDARGVPFDCRILASQAGVLLSDMTCDLMMARARFTPAKGADGIAIPSTWSTRFTWSIPRS